MAHIELTRGLFALVDDRDAERVTAHRWNAKPARQRRENWYAQATIDGKTVYLHRLIVGADRGDIVDHIDGDGLNCSRANLRVGDLSMNAINRPCVNPTGFRGVRRHQRAVTYSATITLRREVHSRHGFRTAEDAARAYDELALTLHGSAARLNFPVPS